MQKKFQVYDWFKTLDGAKRIDFLNGMLHLCFPLELRFLGSCIEELARKDYLYLRDAELKANSIQEIQKFKDICDKITRSKMIVTLALLGSNNFECARALFEFLNVDICRFIEKMKSTYMDAKIADEFLLLLTMAANHPAFDFQMKTKMSHLFISTENKLKSDDIICRENDFDLCSCEKTKIFNENTVLNSYHERKEFKNEIQKDFNEILVKDDNNNNKNNEKQDYNETDRNFKINEKAIYSSSSSSVSLSNTSLYEENDFVPNNENNLVKIKDGDTFDKISANDEHIESINFEGVRSIKGTNNYKFSIKIQWSDLMSGEIHKTYNEICEFNQKLIKLFPQEVTNLLDSNSLVVKEDHKEDFIKEMPMVADYCNKLAKLPKEVFKSELFKSFFLRNLKQSKFEEREKKKDLDRSELNLKSPEKLINNIENLNSDQIDCKKNISKNITISVANVFNKCQKENSTNNNYISKSNHNKLNDNKNKPKLVNFKKLTSDVFKSQINNENSETIQLPILQPISNSEISSPLSPPSVSVSNHSQNFNPSSSLNNSRCSSPWMIMPSSPLHSNNSLNHFSTQVFSLDQNQEQFRKTFQKNQKEFKSENIQHDELLFRYVLDNNSSSNIDNEISTNKSLNPKIKNMTESKNCSGDIKPHKKQTDSISPNSNNFNPDESLLLTNENQVIQLTQQFCNSVQIKNPVAYPIKEFSNSSNNFSNNSQFVFPSQFQSPPNLVQYNNYVPNVSGNIKPPQMPLLLAPVVTKGAPNISFPFSLNQFGSTTIFPQNKPLITNMGHPNLSVNSSSTVSIQERVLSPSILPPIPVVNFNKNNKITKKNHKILLNDNFNSNLSKNNRLKTPSTTSDEDELSKKEDIKNNILSYNDNINGSIFRDKMNADKKETQDNINLQNFVEKNEKEKFENISDKLNNKNKTNVENNISVKFNNFHYKNGNVLSSTDELTDKNQNFGSEFSTINKSDQNKNENTNTSETLKSSSILDNLSTKTTDAYFKGSHYLNTNNFPQSMNNLYYHYPSYNLQDGQNMLKSIPVSNPQHSSNHSSYNEINQTFNQYSVFNQLPLPISIAPTFNSINSQNTGPFIFHQNQAQHTPYFIPFTPPISQLNIQTAKDNSKGEVSPTNSVQMTANQKLTDSKTKNENLYLNQSNSSNFSYTQYPLIVNQPPDGNYPGFENSPHHSQQHHQNILMMLMMGNNFQTQSQNLPNPNYTNKNVSNYNNQHESSKMFSSHDQNLCQTNLKNHKKKKSCFNCGSLNHSANECKETLMENSNNSLNFRLNYKPNYSSNQTQNEINIENNFASPKIKNSKTSFKK